jgi:putative ABC transport system permease protein
MSLLRMLRLRLRALFQRDAIERELSEELQFHIDMQTEENLRAGMPPEEARRQAVLRFGGVEGHKEASRKAQGLDLMGLRASWLDLKLGLRMLVKYPGLTLVGGLALTLAIGLGAAFFEFTEEMVNPQLPIKDGDRIVLVRNWDLAAARPERRSLHDFVTWREEIRTIEDLGVFQGVDQSVTTEDGYTEVLDAGRISASLIRTTGVAPLLGRPLLEEDEQPGAPPVVLIGYGVWQRFFGGDPGAIGQVLRVGSSRATVVGVMPEGYGFPINHSVWTPFRVNGLEHGPREGPPVLVFGKLRRGVSLEEARTELAALGARATADYPETHEQLRPRVVTFGKAIVDAEERLMVHTARFLFLILMIVMCVNVATLVFARTATRESEFAVRSALGASRRRIIGQLFLEALVLTLGAAALGLTAAWVGLRWGTDLFWRIQQTGMPFWWNHALSPATILYTLVLALAAAAMVGIVPALKVTGPRVQPNLSQMSVGSSRMRFGGIWTAIVVIQVALSVAFLPTAILEGRTALRNTERSTEFPADAFVTGRLLRELEAPPVELPEPERAAVFARSAELHEEVKRRVAAEPGVAAVTFANRVPAMNHPVETIHVQDAAAAVPPDTAEGPGARALAVDLDFFDVMSAPIVSGRAFQPSDVEAEGSVIVNETFVRSVMNGRNPVGHRIRYPKREDADAERWYEVVGVVQDTEMDAFGPGKHRAIYHPLKPGRDASLQMFVRVGPRAQAVGPRLRSTINAIDPSLRLGELRTVRELWTPAHQSMRFFAAAQGIVAAIALLLSMAGIHALMAFTVSQRKREIGIRAALGARPGRIFGAIFSRAFVQLGVGVLLGSGLAAVLMGDELTSEGPAMLLAIVATMLTVGLLACFLPARRALRVQPTEALKAGG